jgi:dTDP-4-dehydrorhamnose reductase
VLVNLLPRAGLEGVLHVGGPERMSRYELMRRCAIALGIDAGLVLPNQMSDVLFDEPRPVDVSLDSSRLLSLMPEAFQRGPRGV